jgi:hypothetical protein
MPEIAARSPVVSEAEAAADSSSESDKSEHPAKSSDEARARADIALNKTHFFIISPFMKYNECKKNLQKLYFSKVLCNLLQ